MSAFSAYLLAYDDLINDSFVSYMKMSSLVGGLVKTHSDMVEKAIQSQRQFLLVASRSKKPDDKTLMELLKPLSDHIQQIQDLRNKNRTSEFFNHLSAISESVPALGWVTIFPAPGPYVKEMIDASQFYTNKVLVTYKEKDKTHIDWAKSWLAFLTQLQSYIKQHHTTGVSWNPQGNAAGAQNGASGPPLPPPPPPPGLFADIAPKDDGRAALLQQLNQGTEITKGLRKITDEQQTHKNPALRTSGPAPYKPPVASKPVGRVSPPRGPTKLALEGKKWCVEYHKDDQNLVIDQTEMNQSVNVYKCDNVVLQVKGKINSITVDSCKKFSIVFENIVSVIEFINCQQVKAQALTKVPTITFDKTDGAEVFLGKDSLDVEVVSSKCSALNLSVLDDKTGDYKEHPIPEQLKTIWNGKSFDTSPVDKA